MTFPRNSYMRTTGEAPPPRPEDESGVQPIKRGGAGTGMAPDVPESSVAAAYLRGVPVGSRIRNKGGQRRVLDRRDVFRREAD